MAHAGSAGRSVILNTPEASLSVLDCSRINVSSSDTAPVRVQRTVLAAIDAHAPYYLLATDVLKVGFHPVSKAFA